MLSEADSRGKSFAAVNHQLEPLIIRVLPLVITAKQTHSPAPGSGIVAAGRFSGFANERRRSNARSNSFDTRRQG